MRRACTLSVPLLALISANLRSAVLCALTISVVNSAFAQNFMTRSYMAPTSYAGVPNRGDFNNDGIPDVVYCYSAPGLQGPLAVSLGQPDGTLGAPLYHSSDSGCSGEIALGDFNHDGNLDVVVGANPIRIYLGNGDGTFRLAQEFGGAWPTSTITGDFDNDGNIDVAVITNGSLLLIYPGLGNGTFGTAIPVATMVHPEQQLRVGDFDGDGRTDLIFSGTSGSGTAAYPVVDVLFGNGSFTFTEMIAAQFVAPISTGGLLNAVDINQDGYTDFITGEFGNCDNPPAGQVYCDQYFSTYVSNGKSRSFRRSFTGFLGNGPFAISDATAADVNGDGINDIVGIIRDPSNVRQFGIWTGHPNGTFDTSGTYYRLGGDGPTALVPLDTNRDGRPDFALGDGPLTTMLNAYPRVACATYTASSVPTGCQPANATYVLPSVHFVANAHDASHPVTGFRLFIDNKLSYSTATSHMDLYRTLPGGQHSVVFKESDATGASYLSRRAMNVYTNGTPGATCSTPRGTAHVCLPAQSTVTSPVHILAAGSTLDTPTAVVLYVDGQKKYDASATQNYVDTSLALSAGSHTIVFKAYDASNHAVTASKTVTVK